MAELVLSSVFEVITDRLTSFVLDKFGSVWDFNDDVEKLKRTLTMVEAVLEDAEEQQQTRSAVRIWLSKLKDVAYDAEALLLRLSAGNSLLDRKHADDIKDMVLALDKAAAEGFVFSLSERAVSTTVREKWEYGRESISYVKESEVYGREEDKRKMVELLLYSRAIHGGGGGEGTLSCIAIIGMGGLGKTTLAQLAFNDRKVEQCFGRKVWVFVSHPFDVKRILVAIIQYITRKTWPHSTMDAAQSEVRRLLRYKRYLIVLDDVWTEDSMDWERLRHVLLGTGIDGSKVLITTRSRQVMEALYTQFPTVPYYLGELSEEACWSLFKHRAFGIEHEQKHLYLWKVGEEIARKCGGVPLAAIILGSLMRCKRNFREWAFVRDSKLWNLNEIRKGILPALKLSYSNLPPYLKRCLTFCSLFPRSYQFTKEELIHLWMAEGYIRPKYRDKRQRSRKDDGDDYFGDQRVPEDIGHDYLNDVGMPEDVSNDCFTHRIGQGNAVSDYFNDQRVQEYVGCSDSSNNFRVPEDVGNGYITDLEGRCFFQKIKRCESGIVTVYKMHDIIYDLLQSVTSSEYTVLGHGFEPPTSFNRIRHSSVICDFRSSTIPGDLYEAGHHLRTLLLFSEGNLEMLPKKFYSSFICLFVLNLSNSRLIALDSSIGSLSHLTYLNLSHTSITKLPTQIEGLPSLQTLNLLNCYNLEALPDLRRMTSLRHLKNEGCRKLTRMLESKGRDAPRIYDNIQLQTLPLFVTGGDIDMMFLAHINTLRGTLKVTHLENIEWISRFHLGNGIKSLGLYWGSDDGCPNINPENESIASMFQERKKTEPAGPSQEIQHDPSKGEEVLGKLKLPLVLKTLLIKGYPGFNFPSWDVPYLNIVHLINCRQSKDLPVLGNLQFLTILSLREMHEVRSISKEFYCRGNNSPFPVLKELILVDFPNLKEWFSPDTGGNAFPNLRKLVLKKCPKLTVMPQILSLHHLDLRDCRATLLQSFWNLRSLETLVTEGVKDLPRFPGEFPLRNPCLTTWVIKSCPLLSSLPNELENLDCLKSLEIRWCERLDSLPKNLQYLSALESLEIGDCHSLTSLPKGGNRGLSNLRSLSIENCNNLSSLSMEFQYLTSLEVLNIMFCPLIIEVPPSVRHLSALRSLSIVHCSQLMCLPEGLQNLKVLHSLEIRSCPEVKVLPEWIGKLVSLRSLAISDCHSILALPEGTERLTALQHLSLQDCPQLQQRCRPESGEDWPKIAHVPYKHVELPKLKRPREEGSSSPHH
ncbi:NB-ARC domain containing protein [Trema orientale]|uniref:NB-ARC domain containing protein n=1 Tax=Trema orientale TaxID=63057 RepID=A0A2P5F7G2_TREOI|nr:NB-ARC domain containing protein [Trema orientale]